MLDVQSLIERKTALEAKRRAEAERDLNGRIEAEYTATCEALIADPLASCRLAFEVNAFRCRRLGLNVERTSAIWDYLVGRKRGWRVSVPARPCER